MTFAERRTADRRKPTRLTPEQERELRAYVAAEWPEWPKGTVDGFSPEQRAELYALRRAQAVELAKLDAQVAKEKRLLRQAAIEARVTEALAKAGAGRNAALLLPHVAERVRVTERDGEVVVRDDEVVVHVVDKEGKPRLREGRPMQVEELVSELRRMPELEGFFTKNGRRA